MTFLVPFELAKAIQLLRYVGLPHTFCTDIFTDMLGTDALVQKWAKLTSIRYKQSNTMRWGEMRSARARVRMRELCAKGSSRRKTWHTKAGVGDKLSVAQSYHRREGRHGHRPDRGAVEEDDRRLTVDPLCVPYINVPVLFTRSPQ